MQIKLPDGRRRTSLRLGLIDDDEAEAFKLRVEQLETARDTGHAWNRDLSFWVANLADDLHEKLAKGHLVESRSADTLATLWDAFDRTKADKKPGTRSVIQRARKDFLGFFGDHASARDQTARDADRWYVWLIETRELGKATRGKTVRIVKEMWKMARRDGIVNTSPFDHLSGSTPANPKRKKFIDRPTIARVMDACPDHTWRLILALTRFGGLRCPSELAALHWSDINWERDRFIVNARKTEHFAHGGVRVVPIFPELRPYLVESFERAEPGSDTVFSEITAETNLGTQLERIIKRAGVVPWPATFNNLRASRITELLDEFPIKAVTTWMGNSPKTALDHYAMVHEAHYEKAVQKAVQKAVHHGDILGHKETHEVDASVSKTLAKQAESVSMGLHMPPAVLANSSPGGTRTHTVTILSRVPLPLGYRAGINPCFRIEESLILLECARSGGRLG